MAIIEFKRAVAQATFASNRALSSNIDGIELGVFGQLSQELIDGTLRDAQRRENFYTVLVTPDQRVLVNREAQQGDTLVSRARINFKVADIHLFGDKRLRQNQFIGAGLHSHPYDLPPSPADLLGFMYSDLELDATTAVFVVTPERRIVMFRGERSPQLTTEEAARKVGLWNNNLQERIDTFGRDSMPEPERLDLNKKAQDAQINQIARTYDLSIFRGTLSKSILRRGLL